MSEVLENVSEQKSAQSKMTAASPTEAVEGVTTNNIEVVVKAVPEAIEKAFSAKNENADDSGSKQASDKSLTSPKTDNKKTPAKRTPSKRMSFIERAQRESEELVKNMGGSLEIEGGRRTRSSTRGTPTRSAVTSTPPPPAKKARTSPVSGASTPTKPRGRGRKIDVVGDVGDQEETKSTQNKKKTPAKGKKAAAKNAAENEIAVAEKQDDAKESENKSEQKQEKYSAGLNTVADESQKEPMVSEERKGAIDEIVETDKTDAALEPVIEETQSQIIAAENVTKDSENACASPELISKASDAVKNDSPMETEENKSVEGEKEKIDAKLADSKTVVQATESLPSQKINEPTPEPMDVDSSSKSNDASEKMEDDIVEINEKTEVVQEPVAISTHQTSSAEAILPPNANSLNNSITKPDAVTEVANANENNTEETTPAAHDLNKTENDLCEPKIATSPPITAANDNVTVTTPQTCN